MDLPGYKAPGRKLKKMLGLIDPFVLWETPH
jgi:hypothetical protein